MLLGDFNEFIIQKLVSKINHRRWIPINFYANFRNITKRISIEITEDKHSDIKKFCEQENIDMKDLEWLIIEFGFKRATEYIKELKKKIKNESNLNNLLKPTKKKIFWIF